MNANTENFEFETETRLNDNSVDQTIPFPFLMVLIDREFKWAAKCKRLIGLQGSKRRTFPCPQIREKFSVNGSSENPKNRQLFVKLLSFEECFATKLSFRCVQSR